MFCLLASICLTARAGSLLTSPESFSLVPPVFNLNFLSLSTVMLLELRLMLSRSARPAFSADYFMVEETATLPTEPFLTLVCSGPILVTLLVLKPVLEFYCIVMFRFNSYTK